uniref:flagellar hook-length control protein FliK n=1 Tax=Roseovarius halophilus (ex Wu et al. 2025) TaxID=3376060 RepID=UPI003999CE1C
AGALPVMRTPAASDLSAPAPATPRGVAPQAARRAKSGTVPGVAPADGRNAVAITGQPRPGAVPTPGMMSGATGHGMMRPVAAATPDPMPGNSRETGGSARLPDGVGSAALQPGQRPDMGVMRGVTAHGQARADGHAAGAAAPPAAGTHDAAVSQLAVRDAAMPDMPRDRGALNTNRDVTWPVSRQTGQPPDITRGSPRDAMMPGQVAGSAISPGRADGAVETPPRGAAVPDGPSQPDRMFRAPASAPTAPTPAAAVIATPTGASHLAAPDGSFARPGEGIDRRVGGESALADAGRLQADPVGTARAGAEPATSARDLPRQMAVQISELLHGHKHAQKADRQIDILLDPRELGRVKIALSGGESSVSVNIAADRPETLELLKRHVGSLAAEFSDLGYEQASFTFGGDGFAGTQDDPPGKTSVAGPGPDATGPDTGRPAVLANDDRVDIRL